MELKGYKTFYKDMKNRYGKKFEVGKTYYVNGPLKFGRNGNGLHFAARIEDTLKFFDEDKEIVICEVTSLGEYKEIEETIENQYSDNYDMYVARELRIDRVINREELINFYLGIDPYYKEYRIIKFLMYFKLTEQEINLFKERFMDFSSIYKYILYYQCNEKDIFEKSISDKQKVLTKEGIK